jgi:hypothetical protein
MCGVIILLGCVPGLSLEPRLFNRVVSKSVNHSTVICVVSSPVSETSGQEILLRPGLLGMCVVEFKKISFL